jgi:hypothetical protein
VPAFSKSYFILAFPHELPTKERTYNPQQKKKENLSIRSKETRPSSSVEGQIAYSTHPQSK